NLSAENGLMISGTSPATTSSAMLFPVIGLSIMPMLPWPTATVTLSQPGALPRIGRLSGVLGRKPVHIWLMGQLASEGTRCKAELSNQETPPTVIEVSKPASSLVAPTTMVLS